MLVAHIFDTHRTEHIQTTTVPDGACFSYGNEFCSIRKTHLLGEPFGLVDVASGVGEGDDGCAQLDTLLGCVGGHISGTADGNPLALQKHQAVR